ncbi:MAG TPA: ribosome-binding factor A [Candidatus Paceibacterota bacterium]|nr:ribosome-binding factor A [Candidatus Paceibacterota bacterium]
MNDNRNDRLQEAVREVAAEFLAREANRNSLITVTRADLSEDGKRCNIFLSVFPDSAEEAALAFAQRNRSELSDFFKKRVKALPPHVEFLIDRGEKNRRRLDELSE